VTLVPVLMGLLVRGKIPHENANPLNRFLMRLYRPALEAVLRFPKATLLIAGLVGADRHPGHAAGRRVHAAAGRRRPALHAVGLPGLSVSKATELLQQTDRLIKTVPRSSACSARPAAPTARPTRRRWRCSRPPSSSSRASSGARA
jgi:Cu(I)/Ag(I) efflux system membrane protein CusA/SilA